MAVVTRKKAMGYRLSLNLTTVVVAVVGYSALIAVGAGSAALFLKVSKPEVATAAETQALPGQERPPELIAFANGDRTYNVYRVVTGSRWPLIGRYGVDDLPSIGLKAIGWHTLEERRAPLPDVATARFASLRDAITAK